MSDARELAELYAIGALPDDERVAFEAELARSPALRHVVHELRETAARLALAVPDAEPPARLRARALAAIAPMHLQRAADGDWTPTEIEGVDVRELYDDPARGRQTVLVRMAPGASYPCHRHAGVEECYVLSGDMRDGDVEMRVGDYSRFESGTEHGPLTSRGGCLLLVMHSLDDGVPGVDPRAG